jgi:hypothetical protein
MSQIHLDSIPEMPSRLRWSLRAELQAHIVALPSLPFLSFPSIREGDESLSVTLDRLAQPISILCINRATESRQRHQLFNLVQ